MGAIKKSVSINAPAERVWDVLVKDELNRQWFAVFSKDTYADTDWKQGSRVSFLDGSGMGITGKLTTVEVYKTIAIDYDGVIADGKPDYESKGALEMQGSREIYRLASADGITLLDVELEMPEQYTGMMLEMWDKGIIKIKEIAEIN
ncbi:MAG: SRPBCC domain-containing protein [Mucilaginibacter sp.]